MTETVSGDNTCLEKTTTTSDLEDRKYNSAGQLKYTKVEIHEQGGSLNKRTQIETSHIQYNNCGQIKAYRERGDIIGSADYVFIRGNMTYDIQGRLYSYGETRNDHSYNFGVLEAPPRSVTYVGLKHSGTLFGIPNTLQTYVPWTEYNDLGQVTRMRKQMQWINYFNPLPMTPQSMEGNPQYRGFGHGTFNYRYAYNNRGMVKGFRIHTLNIYALMSHRYWYTAYSYNDGSFANEAYGYDNLGRIVTIRYIYTYTKWGNEHHDGQVINRTQNLQFDEFGRPIETYSEWTMWGESGGDNDGHEGYGWDHYTDIVYGEEGQRISYTREYYSYIEGDSGVSWDVDTHGLENVTITYDEYGGVLNENIDTEWENVEENVDTGFWGSTIGQIVRFIVDVICAILAGPTAGWSLVFMAMFETHVGMSQGLDFAEAFAFAVAQALIAYVAQGLGEWLQNNFAQGSFLHSLGNTLVAGQQVATGSTAAAATTLGLTTAITFATAATVLLVYAVVTSAVRAVLNYGLNLALGVDDDVALDAMLISFAVGVVATVVVSVLVHALKNSRWNISPAKQLDGGKEQSVLIKIGDIYSSSAISSAFVGIFAAEWGKEGEEIAEAFWLIFGANAMGELKDMFDPGDSITSATIPADRINFADIMMRCIDNNSMARFILFTAKSVLNIVIRKNDPDDTSEYMPSTYVGLNADAMNNADIEGSFGERLLWKGLARMSDDIAGGLNNTFLNTDNRGFQHGAREVNGQKGRGVLDNEYNQNLIARHGDTYIEETPLMVEQNGELVPVYTQDTYDLSEGNVKTEFVTKTAFDGMSFHKDMFSNAPMVSIIGSYELVPYCLVEVRCLPRKRIRVRGYASVLLSQSLCF